MESKSCPGSVTGRRPARMGGTATIREWPSILGSLSTRRHPRLHGFWAQFTAICHLAQIQRRRMTAAARPANSRRPESNHASWPRRAHHSCSARITILRNRSWSAVITQCSDGRCWLASRYPTPQQVRSSCLRKGGRNAFGSEMKFSVIGDLALAEAWEPE